METHPTAPAGSGQNPFDQFEEELAELSALRSALSRLDDVRRYARFPYGGAEGLARARADIAQARTLIYAQANRQRRRAARRETQAPST